MNNVFFFLFVILLSQTLAEFPKDYVFKLMNLFILALHIYKKIIFQLVISVVQGILRRKETHSYAFLPHYFCLSY